MEKEQEQIELRSEKVRNIIGRVPPLLIRSGITLISLLVAGLALAACFVPYPENIKVQVEAGMTETSVMELNAFIPYSKISVIKEEMPASIEWEGYNVHNCGYLKGKVKNIHKEVYKVNGKNYFLATLKLNNASDYAIIKKGMEGTATILISDRSFMAYLLSSYIH